MTGAARFLLGAVLGLGLGYAGFLLLRRGSPRRRPRPYLVRVPARERQSPEEQQVA